MGKEISKDQAVSISGLAIDVLKAEQERMRNIGIRMSLGALASKAIIEQIKGK